MENYNQEEQEAINRVYEYAANLLVHERKNKSEVVQLLTEQGIDVNSSELIVANIENQIKIAKRKNASKDMLYGALWCVGGSIATVANIGFIFWGAILFGGIQFLKGLFNYIIA